MKGNLYTIVYAAILGSLCALVLTAAARLTADYREANKQAEKILNILTASKVPMEDNLSAAQLVEIFKTNVREETRGDISIYVYSPAQAQGQAVAFVVPFAGSGVWGPIKGFLALEPDMKTIRGLSFYEQEETPGLGGEIASERFCKQFEGKSVVADDGSIGVVIKAGVGKDGRNKIDAITGATMTCDKVQMMLNKVIEKL